MVLMAFENIQVKIYIFSLASRREDILALVGQPDKEKENWTFVAEGLGK